uniref:CX domain-containing protein n=1 Tax=Caenorhabditis tropicalis TaxID=1561998 RepID=A0A1I7UHF2_9PELO
MKWSTWIPLLLLMFLYSECIAKKGGRGGGGGSSAVGRHYSRSKSYFTRKYSKPGSIEHTSSFRSFVFGATSGLLLFNSGRHIIQDSSQPISFGNRKYYWGEPQYVPDEELPVQCINKIDPQDPQFGRVFFDNESRPQEIVYACPSENNCCGYDCCTESTIFTSIFGLLVILLIVSVISIFVIEGFRWCLHFTYFCKHGHTRDFEPLSI